MTNVDEVQVQTAGEATGEEGVEKAPMVTVSALVRGVDVELRNAVSGAIIAGHDLKLDRGGARSIFAAGNLQLERAGASSILAGGDASIARGGAAAVISAGGVMMERAGSGVTIARRIRVGRSGLAIFALAPQLEVQDGGRVVFGPSAAMAIVGGFAGVGALLAILLRRRSR